LLKIKNRNYWSRNYQYLVNTTHVTFLMAWIMWLP